MRWVRGDIYVRHLFIKRTNKICKKNYVQKVYVMVLDADVELEEFVMFCPREKVFGRLVTNLAQPSNTCDPLENTLLETTLPVK